MAAEQSRRLLADALQAEDRERRRLARALHDTTLQTLLAVAQDLEEAEAGDAAALSRGRDGLAAAIAEMREVLRGIHPPALDHGGLAAALHGLVRDAQGQGGIREVACTIGDDATPGPHDELVVVLARELVRNVVRHADAARLVVQLRREGHRLLLVVADDGRGVFAGTREVAIAMGHLGLASCAERAAGVAGTLEVRPNGHWPVPGTCVEVALPL
ncbi:MAG: hypothetical protein JWO90_2713 [Solirubrobacterales bacterium]|nr:hypothetical protein [Solirubrobacterales bacterium]